MSEHEKIQSFQAFQRGAQGLRQVQEQMFSGNDNHVGDVGEYWAMRYFENRQPQLAPKRTSPYDIILLKTGLRSSGGLGWRDLKKTINCKACNPMWP